MQILKQNFATECENLFACIQYFGKCLAAMEVLWPIICQLIGLSQHYLLLGKKIPYINCQLWQCYVEYLHTSLLSK